MTSAVTHQDAIAVLKADHREVKSLFEDYQQLVARRASDQRRQQLAERICGMLKVHTMIEEELIYPQAHRALGKDDDDLVDEAEVEHASAKDLIVQILDSAPLDRHYNAKVKVLGEYIDHHVREEENELFPKLRKTGMDLDTLGEAMLLRKEELMRREGLAIDEPVE